MEEGWKLLLRPSLPSWPRHGCRGLRLAGSSAPRGAGRDGGIFSPFPYGNDAHSLPLVCVCAWERPFPQQHFNPLPNLATFPGGAGTAGICSLHEKREERKPPPALPRSPGKAAAGAQPFARHRRSPSRKQTPGSSQRCLCLVTQGLTPGEWGATRDPPPCPWRRSLP